jgi:hypothetical protein
VRKLTAPREIKGHHVAATKDDPQYLVESEKSGEQAAHQPEALTKKRRFFFFRKSVCVLQDLRDQFPRAGRFRCGRVSKPMR